MTRRAALLALLALALPLQPAGSDGGVAADVSKVLEDATAAHDAAVQEDLAGNAGLAARLYRRALQLRPAQRESSLRLGTLQLRMQRQSEAEAALPNETAFAPNFSLCRRPHPHRAAFDELLIAGGRGRISQSSLLDGVYGLVTVDFL